MLTETPTMAWACSISAWITPDHPEVIEYLSTLSILTAYVRLYELSSGWTNVIFFDLFIQFAMSSANCSRNEFVCSYACFDRSIVASNITVMFWRSFMV